VHGAEATFTVSASPVQTHPVTVLFSVGGTAALGTDYTLDDTAGQIVIPAGQSSAAVHMHAAALSALATPSRGKTVKLSLSTNNGYKMPKRGGKSATVKILAR
jgi:hypothetical protein